MNEAFWCALNVIVGIPMAIGLLGLGREGVRTLLALALGFRVFEFRWGSGLRLWAKPIGPVEFVFGRMPFAGSILAESGSPKHHHLARLIQAVGPLLLQVTGSIWWASKDSSLSESLRSGYAPLASLAIANLVLIAIHALIPLETRSGFRTDIRSILDICFGKAEGNRQARASYYARYARHCLERAQVDRAMAMLERGLTQLGRDSLLVACESRARNDDLSSVVDQIACADALRALILLAEPRRQERRRTWSRPERIRQALMTSSPLALAMLALLFVEAESISHLAHQRMIRTSDIVANARDAAACETQLTRWKRWAPAFDRVLPDALEIRRDRHGRLARLERCRGEVEAAADHQIHAIFAAEKALTDLARTRSSDPTVWLESEIHLAALLRQSAELDGERNRYRLALATLKRAATALERAEDRLQAEFGPTSSVQPDERFTHEKGRLEQARHEILDRMGAR